ncbi:uncharacterized protein [Littorina saxatilis]|uniref:BHLH domain-containing protein n=1 Tax=Littorina saxatilis TaxID=31220 RepID=A0AAN9BKP4_9CAEN
MPKGSTHPMRHSNKSSAPEVKVKRKCGRPRNPIPRHKRVSHINAEHRRRGKIMNGFQTLKNMVPKYESSGRDSKADILTKAVEHCKVLKRETRDQEKQLKELRAQKQALNADIESYQKNLPEGQFFDEQPMTAQQRLSNFISGKTKDDWKNFVTGYFMKPLHDTFDKMADCTTTASFVATTIDWARQNLSKASLRPMASDALRNLSVETSIIARPDLLPTEALQLCQKDTKPSNDAHMDVQLLTAADATSSSSPQVHQASSRKHNNHNHASHKHQSSSHKHQPSSHKHHSGDKSHSSHRQSKSRSGNKRASAGANKEASFSQEIPPAPTKRTKSSLATSHPQIALKEPARTITKTETLPSCSLSFDRKSLPLKTETAWSSSSEFVPAHPKALSSSEAFWKGVDSPNSFDSAMDQSPLGSSGPESSVFGDLNGYESSSLDQGYDTPSFRNTDSPNILDFLKNSRYDASSPLDEPTDSVLADLGSFDSSDLAETICASIDISQTNSSHGSAFSNAHSFHHPHQHQQQHHHQHQQQQHQQLHNHCGVTNPAQFASTGHSILMEGLTFDDLDGANGPSMMLDSVDTCGLPDFEFWNEHVDFDLPQGDFEIPDSFMAISNNTLLF